MKKKKIGIAFGGGGAKGAWQIGVWKALAEHGYYASAVSGTSVGALNAALYSAYGKEPNGWETGFQAWNSISPQKMLPPNFNVIVNLIEGGIKSIERFPNLHNWLLNFGGLLENLGLFGNDGIKELIKNYFPLSETDREKYLPIFISAHRQDDNECEYLELFSKKENYSALEIEKILTASTAIPYIFEPQEIRGKSYSDGGLDVFGALLDDVIEFQKVDNCPIWPLLDPKHGLDLDMVFALPLNRDEILKYRHDSVYGVPVIPIMPSQDLGSGLNFDPRKVSEKLELGYNDAQRVLAMLKEHIQTEDQMKKAVADIYKEAEKLNRRQNNRNCDFDDSFSLTDILREIEKCDDPEVLSSIAETFSRPSTEEILQFRSSALQDDIDMRLIDTSIKEVLENAEEDKIHDWYIQALSFLSDVESKAKKNERQGLLQRFFHGLTGKNQKIEADSLQELAKSNYCILHLIDSIQRDSVKNYNLFSNLYQQLNKAEAFQQNCIRQFTFCNMLLSRNMISIACQNKAKWLEFNRHLKSVHEEINILKWHTTYWGPIRQAEMKKKTPRYRFCMIMLDYYKNFAYSINNNEKWDHTNLWQVMMDCQITSINDLQAHLAPEEVKELTDVCAADFQMVGKKSEQIDAADIIPVKKSFCPDESVENIQQLALNLLERWKGLLLYPWNPSCSGMKGKYKQYLEKLEGILEGILPEEPVFFKYKDGLGELKKKVADFRLIIYMLGIFSSGKSALLNTWLGDEYLPEDSGPETAVLLKLQYADSSAKQQLIVSDKQGNPCKTVSLAGFSPKKISQTIKQYKDNSRYSELALYLCNTKLKVLDANEIDLADMPGYASGIKGHEEQLYPRLLDQDSNFSFIFCKSQNNETGLRKEDEDFLKQIDLSRSETTPYCLLLTQAGKMHSSEEERNIKLEQLKKRMTELRKRDPLYSGFTDCEEEIGIKGFEEAIDKIIKQRDHQLRVAFQKEFLTFCDDLETDFDMYYKNFSSESDLSVCQNKINQLVGEIEETREKIQKDLLSQESIENNSRSLVESINSKLNNFSTAQEMLASYDRIVRICIKDAVESKFYEIQNEFQNKLGLGTLKYHLELNFSPPEEVELLGKPAWGWWLIGLYELKKCQYEIKDCQTMREKLCEDLEKKFPQIRTAWENNIKEIIDNLTQAAEEKRKMLNKQYERIQSEAGFQERQCNLFKESRDTVIKIIEDFNNYDCQVF